MSMPELTQFQLIIICDAYESGVGKGMDRRDCINPYSDNSVQHRAWQLGYEQGLDRSGKDDE